MRVSADGVGDDDGGGGGRHNGRTQQRKRKRNGKASASAIGSRLPLPDTSDFRSARRVGGSRVRAHVCVCGWRARARARVGTSPSVCVCVRVCGCGGCAPGWCGTSRETCGGGAGGLVKWSRGKKWDTRACGYNDRLLASGRQYAVCTCVIVIVAERAPPIGVQLLLPAIHTLANRTVSFAAIP